MKSQVRDGIYTLNMDEWILVGYFGVDAGLCWIGDPCYVFHADSMPKSLGKDWGDFCDKLNDDDFDKKRHKSFGFDLGHEGLGIAVSTGCGDGSYPVYAKIDNEGTVCGLFIDFMGILEEDSDD